MANGTLCIPTTRDKYTPSESRPSLLPALPFVHSVFFSFYISVSTGSTLTDLYSTSSTRQLHDRRQY